MWLWTSEGAQANESSVFRTVLSHKTHVLGKSDAILPHTRCFITVRRVTRTNLVGAQANCRSGRWCCAPRLPRVPDLRPLSTPTHGRTSLEPSILPRKVAFPRVRIGTGSSPRGGCDAMVRNQPYCKRCPEELIGVSARPPSPEILLMRDAANLSECGFAGMSERVPTSSLCIISTTTIEFAPLPCPYTVE